jgi:hypothetical protein
MNPVKTLIAATALFAATLSTANAALIGVSASAPDFQFLNSTLNYNSTSGQLTVDVVANTNFSSNPNFIDAGGTQFDDLGAFIATGSSDNFNLFLSLVANYNTTTGAFSGGTVTVTGNINYGGFNFGAPPPAAAATLVTGTLSSAGFDFTNPTLASLDFLGTGLSGEMAGLFTGDFGVIVTGVDLPTGFADFTSGVDIVNDGVNVDVTTPGSQIPLPPTWLLLLVGVVAMRNAAALATRA